MTKLSKEANKAKYQYNKKYMAAYWERKAEREQGVEEIRHEPILKKKTVYEYLLPDVSKETVNAPLVNKKDYTGKQEAYIKGLEASNKSLASEKRRLLKLLSAYQEIIKIGVNQINWRAEL